MGLTEIQTAAIADDAVTTDKLANAINTDIAAKMPLAGGTFTGDVTFDNGTNAGKDLRWDESVDSLEFDDSVKATFGADGDLQIYHDGSNSAILNDTGQLTIASDNALNLCSRTGTEYFFRGYLNGAVELYYDNTKRLETDSGGVTVTDDLTVTNDVKLADDGKLICGNSSDLKIYHDGTDTFIKNATGNLLIGDTDGNVVLQGKWGEDSLICKPDGAVELNFDNNKKFETISGGAKVSGDWYNNRNTFIGTVASGQSTISIGTSGGSQIGFFQQSTNDDELRFYTHKAGVSHAERGRMDPDGYFLWACTTQDSNNSTGIRLANTGSIFATRDQEYAAILRRSTNDGGIILFRRDSTDVGNVSVTSSATSYNTGSDYRLKQNDEPISDGITRLKQLKPIKFKFKNDTSKFVEGFFAHEVSAVVPEAITGEKDAVYAEDDETGHKKGDPIYQQIDQAKLVPLLTAALQEAITEIETLKTKVAALEAA